MLENNWRALYKAAVLETDPVKLELRVRPWKMQFARVNRWTARFRAKNAPR